MKLLTFLLLTVLTTMVSASSNVLVLDDTNFDSTTGLASGSASQPFLVEFYAPWCGHCKKLEPTYNQLADQLAGKVNIAKVDGTIAKQVNQRYGIKGFPTIKLFNGKEVIDYKGDRSLNSLAEFAQSTGTITTAQAATNTVKQTVNDAVNTVKETVATTADKVKPTEAVKDTLNKPKAVANDAFAPFRQLYSDISLILSAKTHAAIVLFASGLCLGILLPLLMQMMKSTQAPAVTVKKTQ